MDYLVIFYPMITPPYTPITQPVAGRRRNTVSPQGPLLSSNFGDQELLFLLRNTLAIPGFLNLFLQN